MSRIFATQQQILESIRDRLVDQIPELSRGTCLFSDEPDPVVVPPGDPFLTVSPLDGTFPEPFFAGGGHEQLTEQSGVIVSMFSVILSDHAESLEDVMLSEKNGHLTRLKRRVLIALLVDWEPTRNGNELLRSMMQPTRSVAPHQYGLGDGGQNFLKSQLYFSTEFDWDLT